MKIIPVDFTNLSYHAINDRAARFNNIENSLGWGNPVASAIDKKDRTATATLTDTGVIIIRNSQNMIVTAWFASVKQASDVWARSDNAGRIPSKLWNLLHYINNTYYWQSLVAA